VTIFENRSPAARFLLAAAACAVTTAIASPLIEYLDLANIVMLFLLTVVLISARLGRGPAVMSAFLSVALFDFFFVPPRLSFTVNDAQYLLTFAVVLIIALITAHLTADLRQQAVSAFTREHRTRALYEMARELTGALTLDSASDIVHRFVKKVMSADIELFVPDEDGELQRIGAPPKKGNRYDIRLVRLAHAQGDYADLDVTPPIAYFPLKVSANTRGVMAVSRADGAVGFLADNHDLLEAVASLAAMVVERLHYVDVANTARVEMASERLRSSILSALSHDIRTPLTAMTGLADSLAVAQPALPVGQRETAEAVRDQAMRLSGLVANLLDMARLNAGHVTLRKEWQPLEEVVGSSIKLLGHSLSGHQLRVELPDDLPMLEFDAVLIERVLCNLLANASKYSVAGSAIEIAGRDAGDSVEVSVRDRGPGIRDVQRTEIFEMFVRGEKESAKPGIGLGLAICRAIVDAHRGRIWAENVGGGGACFTFSLPKGTPPRFELEESTANGSV